MTKWNASHSLPHVFLYEKCFLCGKITEWGFDGKLNLLDNSMRDKYGSKIDLIVCVKNKGKEMEQGNRRFLVVTWILPGQRGKLIPGFHRVYAPPFLHLLIPRFC